MRQILAWVDAFQAETGHWPHKESGPVDGEMEETWRRMDNALVFGLRGLREHRGSSLAYILANRRGVRNVRRLPILTEAVILRWAGSP